MGILAQTKLDSQHTVRVWLLSERGGTRTQREIHTGCRVCCQARFAIYMTFSPGEIHNECTRVILVTHLAAYQHFNTQHDSIQKPREIELHNASHRNTAAKSLLLSTSSDPLSRSRWGGQKDKVQREWRTVTGLCALGLPCVFNESILYFTHRSPTL